MRGQWGVINRDAVTAAATTTSSAMPRITTNRVWEVWRTGGAVYEAAGTAYPVHTGADGAPGPVCGVVSVGTGPRKAPRIPRITR